MCAEKKENTVQAECKEGANKIMMVFYKSFYNRLYTASSTLKLRFLHRLINNFLLRKLRLERDESGFKFMTL